MLIVSVQCTKFRVYIFKMKISNFISFLLLSAIVSNPTFIIGIDLNVILSNDDVNFGSAVLFNMSIRMGDNESAEKPALEIRFLPSFRFQSASVISTTCSSYFNDCVTDEHRFKFEQGELMGKSILGDRVIHTTRSFGIISGKETVWKSEYSHESMVKLENVSMVDLKDDDGHVIICVFRYRKKRTGMIAERSIGRDFILRPATASIRIRGKISMYRSILISLISNIDRRGGEVVLKLTVPDDLVIEKSGYALGRGNVTTNAIMQKWNQSGNRIDFYVLITPIMLEMANGDSRAGIELTVKYDGKKREEMTVIGAVLYGKDFGLCMETKPARIDETLARDVGNGKEKNEEDDDSMETPVIPEMVGLDSEMDTDSPEFNTTEIIENQKSTMNTISDDPCGEGWWTLDLVLSDCYYFPNRQLPYKLAEKECNAAGGHLPSFHSTNDLLAFSTFWKNQVEATEVWIGLSRNTSADEWKWEDCSRMVYFDWCDDWPIVNARNCITSSVLNNDNYCWKPRICDQAFYFFCLKPRTAGHH